MTPRPGPAHAPVDPPRWRGRRTVTYVVAVGLALLVTDTALAALNAWPAFGDWLFGRVLVVVFGALAALLTRQRPANNLGWLLLGTVLVTEVGTAAYQYGVAEAAGWAGALPAAAAVGGVGFGLQAGVPFGILITFFLLLFPDGRLPSRRWRPVAAVAVVGITLLTAGTAVSAAQTGLGDVVDRIERTGAFAPTGAAAVVATVGNTLAFLVFPLAVASLFVRWRRADPVERRQLTWFSYGAALLFASILIPWPEPFWLRFETAATFFLPVTVVIAITRYRLYDIDRIVSRTVTYALVTATLAGVYALVAVVPSGVLDLESDLLVAAATLAAAAAFVPLRRRVQETVDRRFNRAGYDARRTVEVLRERVREDLALAALADGLRATVATTVRPSAVGEWLRQETGE